MNEANESLLLQFAEVTIGNVACNVEFVNEANESLLLQFAEVTIGEIAYNVEFMINKAVLLDLRPLQGKWRDFVKLRLSHSFSLQA